MKTYRVGVIGHTGRGNYGHGIDTVWRHFPEQCEVVAVADADEKGLAEAVKRLSNAERKTSPKPFADYRKLLDEAKPDVVAIGPRWLDQHRDMAVAAAQRGMHIYMEKPMCRTPAEADEMVAACEKHDVKLAVAHQTRWSPRLQAVHELIAAGELGTLLELRGRGKEDARGGGEDLWVLGSHVMNLINHFGGNPTWCFARVEEGGKPVTKSHVKAGNEEIGPLAGDSVHAIYGLDSGAVATFGSRRGQGGGKGRFGLQIYGSKGIVEILSSTSMLPSVMFLADPAWSPGRSGAKWVPVTTAGPGRLEPLTDVPESGNIQAVKDLLAAIEGDRQPECSVYEGRTTIEMICAVFESHRIGGPVNFPLKTRENPLSLL